MASKPKTIYVLVLVGLALIRYSMKGRAESIEFAAYGEDKLSNVVVVGNVMCEACSGSSIYFIAGAKVELKCRTNINQKTRSGTSSLVEVAESDENGDFVMEVPSAFHPEERVKWCSIRLLSSPESSCNVPSTAKPSNLTLLSNHNDLHGLHYRTYAPLPSLTYRPRFCYI